MKALLWLRRDLRWHDHRPLAQAIASGLEVQPVFVFDSSILSRFNNKQDRRISFILDALRKMQHELAKHGAGKVIIVYGRPEEVIPALAATLGARKVYAGQDFEPECIKRDAQVAKLLAEKGIKLELVTDHLLLNPTRVLKPDGSAFKVFTPFSKAWRNNLCDLDYSYADSSKLNTITDSTTIARQALPQLHWLDLESDPNDLLDSFGYAYNPHPYWPVEEAEARLERFITNNLEQYKVRRDFPALEDGTSHLSPYLRFGLISIRECYRAAEREKLVHPNKTQGAETWVNELIWREFYAMVLYYHPGSQHQELQPQYRDLPWRTNQELWQKFINAETGYPIIDAAIKQLYKLNWVHNRCRMLIASFQTKHLLLDWRLGEEWFAQHLMDYELASNVGGWQWAASTGTDAQPYFRIFNPTLQSKKFDPEGTYIKTYLPQLSKLQGEALHAPWLAPLLKPTTYPEAIVKHDMARHKALAFFKTHQSIKKAP